MVKFNLNLAREVLSELKCEAERGECGDVSEEYIKGMEFVVEEMGRHDNNFIKGVIDFLREYDSKRRYLLKPEIDKNQK